MSWLFDVFPVFVSIFKPNVENVLPAQHHINSIFINSFGIRNTVFIYSEFYAQNNPKKVAISIRWFQFSGIEAINEPDYKWTEFGRKKTK